MMLLLILVAAIGYFARLRGGRFVCVRFSKRYVFALRPAFGELLLGLLGFGLRHRRNGRYAERGLLGRLRRGLSEKLKAVNHQPVLAPLLAFAVLPLVKLELAFQENGLTLLYIPGERLRALAEGPAVDEADPFLGLPIAILPSVVHRQAKLAHGRLVGQVGEFWVARKVADEDAPVVRSHCESFR